jgi:hypothetical protein
MRRRRVWWRRHLSWIAGFPWPARVVIVLGELAIRYLASGFGIRLGLALSCLIAR